MPVPDFSPGEVLTAAAMDSIGLWLVKTQAVGTGVSSVTVTNAFSADYDNYYVTWTGGTLGGLAAITLQLGPTSVSGYNTSYYGNMPLASSVSSIFYVSFNNTSTFASVGMGSTDAATLSIRLFEPQKARFTRAETSWIDTRTDFAWGQGGAVHRVASAFTDFTVSAGATLTGGTIRVYGYRN